jgi:hypothetical protein
MTKYYTSLLALALLSCGTRIHYLGRTSVPTKDIDVYVDASAIKKPFTIIGKGYPRNVVGTENLRKLQEKAIRLAKEKGADAILFQDYYLTRDDAHVYKLNQSDSTGRVTLSNSSVVPAVSSERNILFLKYDHE